MTLDFIEPRWPAPKGVQAVSTTRRGGQSQGIYASLNLGGHVGDEPARVHANRISLQQTLGLPATPYWLNQVHGTTVLEVAEKNPAPVSADATISFAANQVCVVMTADCLPVLFCNRAGTRIGAAHAGWRGLADGVLEATLAALGEDDWLAWLGPAIGPEAFEVGDEVRLAFQARMADCDTAFRPTPTGRWLADLYQLARLSLAQAGVTAVYGGDYCTYSDPDSFFSYRRDGKTGRMASLIWRE